MFGHSSGTLVDVPVLPGRFSLPVINTIKISQTLQKYLDDINVIYMG